MSKTLKNAPTLKTEVVSYYYNLDDKEQRENYSGLCKHLTEQGYKLTAGIGTYKPDNTSPDNTSSGEVHLDCSHLFDNQWNATDDSPSNAGHRLFDWHESIAPNRKIKSGHYLIVTDEMKDIRENVHKCGYCGSHHHKDEGYIFCPDCLGSKYLTEGQLNLTRMVPVSFNGNRPELSVREKAKLLPKFVDAQIHGNTERDKKRIAKTRKDLKEKRDKVIQNARTEHDGFIWLMDNGIKTDNVIYYKDQFCFGWRSPIGEAEYSKLVDVLCEFPYDYEVKS